ncbi:hypothetical protein ATK17_2925 [Branchiibius hedensis]|uniref:DUF559 domain-containing protein n=1 Tax=Branchiibius hedensis TaxID=672460 RepID=A0A2Y8ZT39_9MICO|nr:hypothetical protein [Branchiibius hedensis]PWJ26750.1 hypothetical protein ATK17_2925 [Branchiibius hedensis]SSA35561.1 hypothetical protein SAMN04489750_2925 [Branchiibius hedensis]
MSELISADLFEGPFTTQQALTAGITYAMLRSAKFEAVFPGRGVWSRARVPRDLRFWLEADRLILPQDAALSHTTGLLAYGVPLSAVGPRHWSTATTVRTAMPLSLHRVVDLGPVRRVRGFRVVDPSRCLQGAAPSLCLLDIIRIGDWLLTKKLITRPELRASSKVAGAARVRQAECWMRVGSESFRETSVRTILRLAGLPNPQVNPNIVDAQGNFVARGDLPYPQWKVLVEYDGWHHERSASQRQEDIERREKLDRLGWRSVVLTSRDHDDPPALVNRVWTMLKLQGYRGPAPLFDHERWARLTEVPRKSGSRVSGSRTSAPSSDTGLSIQAATGTRLRDTA